MEVLVSLTLLAVIGALVSFGFRIALDASSKGEAALEVLRTRATTVAVLDEQLRGALPILQIQGDNLTRRQHIGFDGDRRRLRFVSRTSFSVGPNSFPRWVNLELQESQNSAALVVKEFRILPPDNQPEESTLGQEIRIPVSDAEFQYLRRSRGTAEAEWIESWSNDEQQELPAAVRLTLKWNDKSSTIVAPIELAPTNWRGMWLQ